MSDNPEIEQEVVPLAFLYRVSRELSSGLDLRNVLRRVLLLSMINTGATRGSIIVLDSDMHPLDSIIIHDNQVYEHTTEQLRATLEQGLAGWVLHNHQAALVNNSHKDSRWLQRPDDHVDQTGAKSAVCAPLTARDNAVGVMTLVHPRPNSFTQKHLELVQAIADQAGIAVLNARLYAESQQQVEQIRLAHQRYRELQENLSAMIYHDLRSPLANVTNSLELIKIFLPIEDPTIQSVFGIMQRAIDRIIRLTNSLLDISRLESENPIINLEKVDSRVLINEAVEVVTPIIREKNQTIDINLSEIPLTVLVDKDMILRVLINLIENASKYTPNDNVITVGTRLYVDDSGKDYVEFWVKDTGYGIPEKDRDFIFEKFSRLEAHRDKAKGIGLGLTFCRLAVEGHGGRIWVESEVEKGSRFAFILPIDRDKM
jgi:signal transduction histidine kinase